MVAGTLLLSSCVIMIVGWILLEQVTDGLVQNRTEASLREARTGIQAAQQRIEAADPSDSTSEIATRLANELYQRGLYDFVLEVDPGMSRSVVPSVRTTKALPQSVPDEIREQTSTGELAYTYTEIKTRDGAERPGMVVGSQLIDPRSGGAFKVFYLFDFRQEQSTLSLLNQSLIAVGTLIVVLLGFVAWFVARQVVTPVRMARQIAERLAAGLLDERMQVYGQDDLARLATSFNQMASNLQRQIRQLEELSRVQRRFVSDVSHELRTPITTVRMASDVLYEAREQFAPGVGRSAELLQTELDRFETLLADLLEISRYDAGAATLNLEQLDIRTTVQQVAQRLGALAERKGSALSVQLPDEPVLLEMDGRRIERVIRNLLGNAIDYGEGEQIEVRVVAASDAVALSVRDHGIGLQPGESALVFDRFWRSDPARARTTGGTGLGLSIALEDVLLHGGWLQAWGAPGDGSHFRVTLPRTALAPLNHSPSPLVPPDRGTRTAEEVG